MYKYALLTILSFILTGCYSAPCMWLRDNLTFSCPNKYEKTVVRNSCNVERTTLKLEEHCWDVDEFSRTLKQMEEQVYNERLYVNKIITFSWRGDLAIVVFASSEPSSISDMDELSEHRYRKIREEKCRCRLCR